MKKVIYLSAALAVLSGDTFCMSFDVAEKTITEAAQGHSAVKVSAVQRNLMRNWLHSSKISAEDVKSFFEGSGAFEEKTGNFDVLRGIAQGGQSRLATMKAKNITADEYKKLDAAGVFSDRKEGSVASRQVRSDLDAAKKEEVQKLLGEKNDRFFGGAATQPQPEKENKTSAMTDAEIFLAAKALEIEVTQAQLDNQDQREKIEQQLQEIFLQQGKLAKAVDEANKKLMAIPGFKAEDIKGSQDLVYTGKKFDRDPIDEYLVLAKKALTVGELYKGFVEVKAQAKIALADYGALFDALSAFMKEPDTGLAALVGACTTEKAKALVGTTAIEVDGDATQLSAVAEKEVANKWFLAQANSMIMSKKTGQLSPTNAVIILKTIAQYNTAKTGADQKFSDWGGLKKLLPSVFDDVVEKAAQ